MKRVSLFVAIGAAAAGCAAITGLKDVPSNAGSPDASAKGGDGAVDASPPIDVARSDAGATDATVPDAQAVAPDAGTGAAEAAAVDACAAGCGGSASFCVSGACVAEPPSCETGDAGGANCGPGGGGTESCCTSLEIDGGDFYRSYDGVTNTDTSFPATVSGFRLDKYEVTVGRFRPFVNAVAAGWLPAAGSGIHAHLNGGKGLVGNPGSGYELGWDAFWNSNLPSSLSDWNTTLECAAGDQTWTPIPGASESEPINCVTWQEAYAFCIWDGGFLPSETEWNFAAAGGSQQRAYPWSNPPTSTLLDCTYANYSGGADGGPCGGAGPNEVGSESPKDLSRWGHADLAGNVTEWVLDWYGDYANPCTDCANLVETTDRRLRGGFFSEPDPTEILVSSRDNTSWTNAFSQIGLRCARVP